MRLLCHVRYWHSVRSDTVYGAMSGTGMAYGTVLSAYARARRCPVLSSRMVLPGPFPRSGVYAEG
eukprot:2255237-Rhodomonas_salina.1